MAAAVGDLQVMDRLTAKPTRPSTRGGRIRICQDARVSTSAPGFHCVRQIAETNMRCQTHGLIQTRWPGCWRSRAPVPPVLGLGYKQIIVPAQILVWTNNERDSASSAIPWPALVVMVVPFASATHRFAVTAHAEPSTRQRGERKPASVGCSVAAPSRVPHIDLWIPSVLLLSAGHSSDILLSVFRGGLDCC
ncbi:hypothetical protein BGZ61DRAFT_477317 [Ilyonectria robusta]|uniref:uncharacterized protein n=1 Tax=Ilyonectria robusta TaxID=1079257 RepID=UPI001E8D3ACA|nr:uncharacterized protein BGZ61DRAFT_477317 [Ilyonectria robusta]KAH8706699.1 hypothetical protein BGZ61DRAFT_477317 [Ilyonectria robusta]